MNEPMLWGDILRGYAAKLLAPHAPRAVVDPTRLGIPRKPLPPLLRRSVLQRDGFRCVWCQNTGVRFEVDHIVPWIAGGSDHPVNLRTLCRECNQERSNRVLEEFDSRALPIVWRCFSCDEWGDIEFDVEATGPALIAAYCTTCRRLWEHVPYIADLMLGGEVPTVGIPALVEGDQDYEAIAVTVRPMERRFKDWREKDDRRRAAIDLATHRAEARAELDAIRPPSSEEST